MFELKNRLFTIGFDENNGTPVSWRLNSDPTNATWIEPGYVWGRVYGFDGKPEVKTYTDKIVSVYNGGITLTITRQITETAFEESYIFHNNKNVDYFLRENEWGIYVPFHSCTSETKEDLYHTRFITDLWCGGDVCWAKTTRISGENPWLLTYMTKGKIKSYSQERDFKSGNDYRGTLVLNPAPEAIPVGGEMEISLRHTFETDSLENALAGYDGHLELSADLYTVYVGEKLHMTGKFSGKAENVSVTLNEQNVPFTLENNVINVEYKCDSAGERTFCFTVNGKTGFIVTNTILPLSILLEKRAKFICEKQQYHCSGSPLDGAYLIYDDRSKSLYYNDGFYDHNAGRERFAFAITVARELRHKYDAKLAASLDKYTGFIEREMLDTETGIVYNEVHKNNNWNRLYNYPWLSAFYYERYMLNGDIRDLTIAGRILRSASAQSAATGEEAFRCGSYAVLPTMRELKKAGLTELYNEIIYSLRQIADPIEKAKNNVRASGVEGSLHADTGVDEAVLLIIVYAVTNEEKYRTAAHEYITKAFNIAGTQPDFRLNTNPTRYWESYWFGSDKRYGDVCPHMWNAETALACYLWQTVTGERSFEQRMLNNSRSVMSLYREDGFASHAYHYYFEFRGIDTMENNPYEFTNVDTYWGKYYDRWSNDQDWAIIYADTVINGF